MGVGDPLEAAFTLAGPIKAGEWDLIGDGIVVVSGGVDIRFDVIWRPRTDAGVGADVPLVSFQNHFASLPAGPGQFNAVPFEATGSGVAADAVAGDLLVLRFTAMNAPPGAMAFVPNGDGFKTMGRIPSITLPR